MDRLTEHISSWDEVRRLQMKGYAAIGALGFVLGLSMGQPISANLVGIAFVVVLFVVVRIRPMRLARIPPIKPRPRWVYLTVQGPLAYALGSAGLIAIAWIVERQTHHDGLTTVAVSVMSAFAIGAALLLSSAQVADSSEPPPETVSVSR